MSVRIVIDSTTDISPELKEKVTIVPLSIFFGEDEFIDGVTINHKMFYEKLIESDVIPTTSQASPAAFEKIFSDARNSGDSVVVVTIASKLSGTHQSAVIAAEDFDNVYVVDSKTVAIGAGILTELAVKLKEEGLDAKSIAERITEECEKVHIIALLDTLEYLKKGGRISATAAIAGTLLSIKPVVSLYNGEINVLGKARGSKQGNNLLVKEIQALGGVDFNKPVMLGYTGLSDILLQKYITDSAFLWEGNLSEFNIAAIGSTIGTHVGPGAIAVAFFKN